MIVMGIHKGTIVTGAMRKRHIPARSIGPALVVVLTIGAVATSGVATLGLTVPASFAQQPAATPGTSAVQGAPAAKAAPPPSAAPAGNAVGAGTAWKAEVKESGTQSGVTHGDRHIPRP